MELEILRKKFSHSHTEYLEKNIYPSLTSAVEQLVKELLEKPEVNKYQELLFHQKEKDKKERKKIEKQYKVENGGILDWLT